MIHSLLQGKRLVVISNREPYIHPDRERPECVVRPASGLVSALEPILRETGGLWIAHGSGSADFEVTNSQNEIRVPPGVEKYQLRRVRLSKAEEKGYYFGFANEGLWPLCHLAHQKPHFRLDDWHSYRQVNQIFTNSIPESHLNSSLILVQDYHLALVPGLIRERLKNLNSLSKIALFWHIPWPHPEVFGICPWAKQILTGMLGAHLIGFHTQSHCRNFIETCGRHLEARIDLERFSVTINRQETLIRPFPIGIDTAPIQTLTKHELQSLKKKYGIKTQWVAIGVDRIDYTKGLIERIQAVERFLEKYPQYIGRFCLLQIGSPSRTIIDSYQSFTDEFIQTIDRVNRRFSGSFTGGDYQPIYFQSRHHEWEEVQAFYQIGDICLVTSLHDGMNLVAKEYVWCQSPDQGALILSQFTGASRELKEALIVNPYSVEDMADAIASAIALTPTEKSKRMIPMKERIRNQNALCWATQLLKALTDPEPGSLYENFRISTTKNVISSSRTGEA